MKSQRSKLRRLAFSKITVLSLTALLVAAIGISVANDLYAFVKPEGEIVLSLDEPHSLKELSKTLEEQGVIANPTVFRLWVQSKGKTELLEGFCGTLTLNSAMSYRQILLCFSQ
ncbi:MAG: hypothetical protein J6Q82_03505 [Clostridia bacterium]|nr:hypothetical protein [Clostridia bacterium]